MGYQYLLADVGLHTGAPFLGTAIINVAVDVAVLLAFGYLLGGYGAAARSTAQEAAKSRRLFLGFLNPAAQFQNFLHFIKKPLFDYRGVAAFVYFPGVAELAVIKRIGEYPLHFVFVQCFVAAPRFSRFGSYAVLVKEAFDVFEARSVFGVNLKRPPDDRGFALVHDDCFGSRIIQVADGRGRGIVAPFRLLAQSATRVPAQVADVLGRHAELDGHQKHTVFGVIAALRRLDVLDHALLKQPTYLTAIHRIAGQAVEIPVYDALRFAPSYPVKHFVKDGAAGVFGGLLFHEFLGDNQPFGFRQRSQDGKLVLNRPNLLVFSIG